MEMRKIVLLIIGVIVFFIMLTQIFNINKLYAEYREFLKLEKEKPETKCNQFKNVKDCYTNKCLPHLDAEKKLSCYECPSLGTCNMYPEEYPNLCKADPCNFGCTFLAIDTTFITDKTYNGACKSTNKADYDKHSNEYSYFLDYQAQKYFENSQFTEGKNAIKEMNYTLLPEIEFKPLDVIRWEIVTVDSNGAESGYTVMDRFCNRLDTLLEKNEDRPLVVRVVIQGETTAHSELLANVDRWGNEIRAAALDTSGHRVWIEKIKFHTRLPTSEKDLQTGDGAMGELVRLFDEYSDQPDLLRGLSDELMDLEKKMPKELKQDPDRIRFDDTQWLKSLLAQARPMLIQRLMQKEDSQ